MSSDNDQRRNGMGCCEQTTLRRTGMQRDAEIDRKEERERERGEGAGVSNSRPGGEWARHASTKWDWTLWPCRTTFGSCSARPSPLRSVRPIPSHLSTISQPTSTVSKFHYRRRPICGPPRHLEKYSTIYIYFLRGMEVDFYVRG